MTMASDETLREYLTRTRTGGLETPRMQWMIITWDLARIDEDTDDHCRMLLGLDGFVSLTGPRSPANFQGGREPITGSVVKFAGADNDSLLEAAQETELALGEDFRRVCRPLAVDCSAFDVAGDTPTDLLEGFYDESRGSRLLLQYLNSVRARAMDSHLDPDWAQHFPGHIDRELWEGR